MRGKKVKLQGRTALNKAIFVLEYAMLIFILMLGCAGMFVYLKRALSGKWRSVGDSIGYGMQYDPHSTMTYEGILVEDAEREP